MNISVSDFQISHFTRSWEAITNCALKVLQQYKMLSCAIFPSIKNDADEETEANEFMITQLI